MTTKIQISSRRSRQKGFAAIVYALMILTLMGFAGFAVDVGYMQYQKRRLQAAADAAAMGALRELELGNTDLTTAGQNDSALNGYTNGTNNTTVTISNPPTTGAFSGQSTAIMATVSKQIPTFFMQMAGQSNETLRATAVAQTSSTYGSVGGCLFAMNASASSALAVDGNATVSTACGAVVNSTSSSAFEMAGSSVFQLATGAQVGVVGSSDMKGGAVLEQMQGTSYVNVTPVKIASFSDPLANVTAPTPTSMSLAGYNVLNQGTYSVNPNKSASLSPGIYCGGMDFKGTVFFNPGIYVLAGGGMSVNSQASLSGTNVMFYNTSSSSAAWGCTTSSGAGSFTFNGGATINLESTTSNSPVGVLFMDDRSITGLSHSILGNSTSTFDGALYFLHASIRFQGTNKTPGFLYVVADTIEVTGNANLANDKSDLASVNTLAPSSTGGGLVY
jgi:Flp pilus assembly protein TadG